MVLMALDRGRFVVVHTFHSAAWWHHYRMLNCKMNPNVGFLAPQGIVVKFGNEQHSMASLLHTSFPPISEWVSIGGPKIPNFIKFMFLTLQG